MSVVFEALDNWKSCMQFIVQISGVASSYLIKNIYRKENKKERKDRHSEPNIKIIIPASLLLLDECVSKREMWINAV